MFRQQTVSIDDEPAFNGDRASGIDSESPFSTLDRIYHGERDAGHPMMLVIDENGNESPLARARGGFDWGWPSMNGTRRLARALMMDVTGREPPPGRSCPTFPGGHSLSVAETCWNGSIHAAMSSRRGRWRTTRRSSAPEPRA